jgi:hypothetical protein
MKNQILIPIPLQICSNAFTPLSFNRQSMQG